MEYNAEWKRKELKKQAKQVLGRNYWKMVVFCLIFGFFLGTGQVSASLMQPVIEEAINSGAEKLSEDTTTDSVEVTFEKGTETANKDENDRVGIFITAIVFLVILFVSMFVCFSIIFLLDIFVMNPVYVGSMRSMVHGFYRGIKIKEILHVFDCGYKNVVRIMLMRDLCNFGWFLLLVVPGIIKKYEYKMIPYLLGDNPHMDLHQAFAESKKMMRGQKWKAFVLDLSFLGWQLLNLLTLGILGVFYVKPYMLLTGAALYRRLNGADQVPENVYFEDMEQEKYLS